MSLKEQVDVLLKAAVELGDVPGVVAIVVNRGNTLYEGAFGKRNLSTGEPMTIETDRFFTRSSSRPRRRWGTA